MRKTILTISTALMCYVAQAQSLTREQSQFLSDAEQQGYVSCRCSENSIYVKPVLWVRLPYSQKETLGKMYSIKCANERRSNLYYVNIFDFYSGRKIAKYSKSFGFDVY